MEVQSPTRLIWKRERSNWAFSLFELVPCVPDAYRLYFAARGPFGIQSGIAVDPEIFGAFTLAVYRAAVHIGEREKEARSGSSGVACTYVDDSSDFYSIRTFEIHAETWATRFLCIYSKTGTTTDFGYFLGLRHDEIAPFVADCVDALRALQRDIANGASPLAIPPNALSESTAGLDIFASVRRHLLKTADARPVPLPEHSDPRRLRSANTTAQALATDHSVARHSARVFYPVPLFSMDATERKTVRRRILDWIKTSFRQAYEPQARQRYTNLCGLSGKVFDATVVALLIFLVFASNLA